MRRTDPRTASSAAVPPVTAMPVAAVPVAALPVAALPVAALAVALSGAAAVAAYLGATILGAAVTPGYSHLADPISELTSAHAPHRASLAVGYVGYNLATGLFAGALWRLAPRSRTSAVAAALTVAGSLAGIGQVTAFPQDTPGEPATAVGAVHIGLAAVSALLTVGCIAVYARVFARDLGAARLASFSVRCAVVIVVTGPLAAAAVGSSVTGAAERLPIGTFLVWLGGVSAWAGRAWWRTRPPRRQPSSDR